VPYHPAGRLPERKVSNPVAAVLPGAALPGELGLLERLARVPDAPQRLRLLYDEDEAGIDARLEDPVELGPAYDPREALGNDASWDALAAWGCGEGGFAAALRERLSSTLKTRWVLVEGRQDHLGGPSLLDAIAAEVPDEARLPWGGLDDLGDRLAALVDGVEDRLVLVAEEAGVTAALRGLVARADVRDQVVAVVSIGGVIGGRTDEQGELSEAACADWMGQWFAQRHLDTDVVRLTPYFAMQWLDREAWPPGVPGQPLQHARFPEPDDEQASAEIVEVVDLGPLPADEDLPVVLVARALVTVVSCWLASRR
jgi:hypothetical protein